MISKKGLICCAPPPQISPVTGPREGGTRVTIEGENLGLQVKEIAHVQVAGVRCNPIPSQYISAERLVELACWYERSISKVESDRLSVCRIVCDMAEALLPHSPGGRVEVCIGLCNEEYRAFSSDTYAFVVSASAFCWCVYMHLSYHFALFVMETERLTYQD